VNSTIDSVIAVNALKRSVLFFNDHKIKIFYKTLENLILQLENMNHLVNVLKWYYKSIIFPRYLYIKYGENNYY